MGLREVGYPALILYPKRAFGIIDFDPLEYTIECELVMLTISAQNAKKLRCEISRGGLISGVDRT